MLNFIFPFLLIATPSKVIDTAPTIHNGKAAVKITHLDGSIKYNILGSCEGCHPTHTHKDSDINLPNGVTIDLTSAPQSSTDGACIMELIQCEEFFTCVSKTSIDFTISMPSGWITALVVEEPYTFIGYYGNGTHSVPFEYAPGCDKQTRLFFDLVISDASGIKGWWAFAVTLGCSICVENKQ